MTATVLEYPPGHHRYITQMTMYWGPCGHRDDPEGPMCGQVYSATVHRATVAPPSPRPAQPLENEGPTVGSGSFRDFYGMPSFEPAPAHSTSVINRSEQHG